MKLKNPITMRSLPIILFLVYSFSLLGQETDYIAEMYANDHAIAQKEGTSELLKEYLAPYKNKGEKLFAILFSPRACPRCEAEINYLLDNIEKIKPGADIVLIASYPDTQIAKEYLQQFHTNNIIIDTENKHEKIFYYRAGRLAVTYFLQIDMNKGRLMCGGDSPTMNEEFLQQFCYNTTYMPYASKDNLLQIKPDSQEKRVIQNTYPHIFVKEEKEKNISSSLEMPQWRGDTFLYSDELASVGRLFHIKNDTAYLEKEIFPTNSQEKSFVQLADSTYEKLKKKGYIYIMANTCAFIPNTNQAVVSYSLPDMFIKEGDNIAYYNHNAFLVTENADTVCNMFSFDFEKNSIPLYMYTHASPFFPINERYILIGCQRGYPISITSEQLRNDSMSIDNNIFLPEFYNYSPFFAIFDRQTGKHIQRFGELDDIFRICKTGYYFTVPVADVYKDILVYSDGFSGKLWITNTNDYRTGQKIELFCVTINNLPQREPLQYTEDYLETFFEDFNKQIEIIKLDSDGIHCLIRSGKSAAKEDGDSYEYRLLDYNGKLQFQCPLLFEENDQILSIGLGINTNKKIFPFYFCKNDKGAFLKHITFKDSHYIQNADYNK